MRVRRVAAAAAVVAAVTSPLWGPAALSPFRFFAVRRIEVKGARYLAPAAIVDAMGLPPRASVWTSTKALERRLDALAGVASVRVTRRLPGTLVVAVTEVEPVALAEGPAGLVPVDAGGRPLPYDPAQVPVDAPVVASADPRLVAALATVRATDLGLFADIAAARDARAMAVGDAAAGAAGEGSEGGVVLDLEDGRARLAVPVDPAVVRALAAVREDLNDRRVPWVELDGRYRGWVVVRRPPPGASAAWSGGVRAGRPAHRKVAAPAARAQRARPPARRVRPARTRGRLKGARAA